MKRYQKLIQDAVGEGSESRAPSKKSGYNILAREMGAPSTSIHEWATYPHKVPAYKSLERLSAYFEVPLPTLLMEAGTIKSPDDEIVEALFRLNDDQKFQIVDLIHSFNKTIRE